MLVQRGGRRPPPPPVGTIRFLLSSCTLRGADRTSQQQVAAADIYGPTLAARRRYCRMSPPLADDRVSFWRDAGSNANSGFFFLDRRRSPLCLRNRVRPPATTANHLVDTGSRDARTYPAACLTRLRRLGKSPPTRLLV